MQKDGSGRAEKGHEQESQWDSDGFCGFDNERRRQCRRLRQEVKAVGRHEFEASNTKLEHEKCRCCGRPGSALREFTSSERLANHLKITEVVQVGKLVTMTEVDAPKIGKLVTKTEMGGPQLGKLEKFKNK